MLLRFLSTPSARRATDFDPDAAKEEIISIHALREEGDGQQRHGRHDPDAISIHALREEGDSVRTEIKEVQTIFLSTPSARRATGRWTGRPGGWKISIHALREEGDTFQPRCAPAAERFLSTPSARRATWCVPCNRICAEDFYPRPPRGGRLASRTLITATGRFLSTPSARRATSCPTSLM